MEIKINKIKISSGYITGVIGDYEYFLNSLYDDKFINNSVVVDNEKLSVDEKREFLKEVSIVDEDIKDSSTVYMYMKKQILSNFLNLKDYHKKIAGSLKIVGLDTSYLDKNMNILSLSEKKLLALATALMLNPNVIVFNNFFNGLDIKNTKKIIKVVSQLVERYNKVVLIFSNDSEFVYKYTKKIIILANNQLLISGNTDDIFEGNSKLLEDNNILIPKTILFTNMVLKNKNIKLNYNKDIRDLIKDIYKKI